jgi:hypothetical protein
VKALFRLLIGAVGLFNVVIGLLFLTQPITYAARFYLAPIGTQGLASVRADFPAFFITGGLFALWGAWRADPGPLKVPAVLLGLALGGRVVSILLDGTAPTTAPPMIAEAVMIALLLAGMRVFAKRQNGPV